MFAGCAGQAQWPAPPIRGFLEGMSISISFNHGFLSYVPVFNSVVFLLLAELTCAPPMKKGAHDVETYRGRLQDKAKAEHYAKRFEQGSRKRIDRREQRAVLKIFAGLRV